ncbi:hypothetical protein Tco_1176694 [Tanacetum coccineum]
MEHEVLNRCDDINDYEDCDQENCELLDLPTFYDTNEIASDSEQVEENIDIAEEKEEVPIKDVEMDENHDIDHLGTEEALQWSFAEDPFLVVIELNDQSSFLLHTIPSFISNEVKRKFTTPHSISLQGNGIRGRHFKSGLVRYHAEDNDGIFVIMDVARRIRLGAWLRACCLFIIPSKSRVVFRSNSTLIFNFHFLNV